VQLSVKVVVDINGPVGSLPLIGREPVQPPDAVQLSAWVVVQLIEDA
jgi:hypothetical protein